MRVINNRSKSRYGRRFCFLLLASASQVAHAHGEEILTSIFTELASVVFCLAILFLRPRFKPYRAIGFIACFVGMAAENWALSGLPYMQYSHLITAAGLIVPPASIVSAVYLAKRIGNKE